ncbi:response regulator [Streptomyces gamaensis]|uniref:Response regulator n=1 Tax=Streptomyces gamaensis TaxID=1763542 RepID=A0ABW0YZ10_9ACTN
MIKVMLVDDDSIVRQGLGSILEAAADIHVVAQAGDGLQAVEAARTLQPDVVLMDIRMPQMDGLTATEMMMSQLADPPKVVMLTTFGQDDYVRSALRAGAAGFLLKDSEPEELIRAIRVVHAGDAMLSPAVTRRLIESYTAVPAVDESTQQALARLTERERQVLGAVARGLSNAEIAQELFMSEGTVKSHISSIFGKLGTTNRVQAALLAHTAGLGGRGAEG